MPAIVGPWAKEKLEALARYLDFYSKVLKNQSWRTVYVDAFAGGGRAMIRQPRHRDAGGDRLPIGREDLEPEQMELIDGSPRVALDVANPFSRYVFIESDPERRAELQLLQSEYGERRRIDILASNAAEGISWVASQKISTATHRGVAFLDPFGTGLEWASVQALAETKLFEVVINFGLSMAIQRMLPNDGNVPQSWARILDAYFGSRAWFDAVYHERVGGLFAMPGFEKHDDYSERLLELYRVSLKAAFGHVSTPRLIRNTRGVPLYYLLWAGPHPKGLEGANYILTMGERLKPAKRGRTAA